MSSSFYNQDRRQRQRQMSYQAYLAGDVENMVAAETAASEMSPTTKAILIGVATGALTLCVNRIIDRYFFGK